MAHEGDDEFQEMDEMDEIEEELSHAESGEKLRLQMTLGALDARVLGFEARPSLIGGLLIAMVLLALLMFVLVSI